MGPLVKIFFTVVLVAGAVMFLLFIDRGDRGASDAGWWRGGKTDLMRRAVLREDGRFRTGARFLISMLFLGLVVVLWTVVP